MVFFLVTLLHIFRTPLLKNTSGGVLLQSWRLWSLLTILSNKTFYLKSDEYSGETYRKIKIIVLAAPKAFRHKLLMSETDKSKTLQHSKNVVHFVARRNICRDSIVFKRDSFKSWIQNHTESRGVLTHFSLVSHFYTPWTRQKSKGFLTFSGGIEMWHWTKMG